MSNLLPRFVVPLAAFGLAILALGQANAQPTGDKKTDKPADKAVPKDKTDAKDDKAADKKDDNARRPRIDVPRFERPKLNIERPNPRFDAPNLRFGQGRPFRSDDGEKQPDVSLQLPAVQKLKDAELQFLKARDAAVKEIDAAIEKAEAELVEANKNVHDKDKDVRAKAQTASSKLRQDVSNLKAARSRATSQQAPAMQPQESRLAAKFDHVGDLTAAQLKLEKGQGLVIVGVEKGGPADKAGLKANDILVAIDGKTVGAELKDLRKVLADIQPDASVTVTVLRAGARESIGNLKLPGVTTK